ncbi:pilus assembly protein PilM [bacterium]|nr:pilus assembly protein PilM [bacterium]
MIKIPKFHQAQWSTTLAFDWAGQSIKYVVLRQAGNKLRVESFRHAVLPMDLAEADSLIVRLMRQVFRQKSLRKANIILGLDGIPVIVKRGGFPKLPIKDLRQTLFFEIQNEFEKESSEANLITDFITLGPDPANPENTEYLFFGAPEEGINQRIRYLEAEGVYPRKVSSSIVVIRNLFQYLPPGAQAEVVAFLDIGATRSLLAFYTNGNVDFHREIVIGGEDFTRAITGTIFHEGQAIQFTQEQATEFKIKYGYPLGFSEAMTFHGAPLSEVGAMMRPVVERLIGEIHRSIGFYKDKSGGRQLSSLYLMGGGARLKHLAEVLSDKLQLNVSPLPVPADVQVAGGERYEKMFRARFLEYAVGFALAKDTHPQGNLLPPLYRKIHFFSFLHKWANIAAMFTAGLALVVFLYHFLKVDALQSHIRDIQTRAEDAENASKRYDQALTNKRNLDERVRMLKAKIQQDTSVVQVMRAFSHLLPENLTLYSVKLGDEKELFKTEAAAQTAKQADQARAKKEAGATASVQVPQQTLMVLVEGESKMSIPDVRISVAQFMLNLEKSGILSEVHLREELTIPDTDEYTFSISGRLNR